jgi:hypothetical protein
MTNDDRIVRLTGIAAPDEGVDEWPIILQQLEELEAIAYRAGIAITVQYARKPLQEEEEQISRGFSCSVELFVPAVVYDVLLAIASSGATAGVMQILKTWVDARNGRKLKVKVGDIEVEATQMSEKDVLRIFELLQEKEDNKNIRDLLLSNNPRKSADTNTPVSLKKGEFRSFPAFQPHEKTCIGTRRPGIR